ncbi:MAG TPA: hypothetical protein VFP68_08995 [Burkholderiaceae bacterium]|nr:hypothetical protein [Burkholderiaceae bacterium]
MDADNADALDERFEDIADDGALDGKAGCTVDACLLEFGATECVALDPLAAYEEPPPA